MTDENDRPTISGATTTIEAPADAVWGVLTDPEHLGGFFMGATVATDWTVGHPITFAGEWKGRQYEDKGEILELERPSRLAFSHWSPLSGGDDAPENYHVVTIELDGQGDRTEVSLAQSNLDGHVSDEDRAAREEFDRNWSQMLEGLKAAAEQSGT